MDDAARVRIGHRLADGGEDRQVAVPVLGDVRACREQRGEGLALHELHREEGLAVLPEADLVDGHDARVLQLSADLRLLHEALHDLGVALVLLADHLHRHVAAQVHVVALEHDSHAAASDLAQHAVAPLALARPARGHHHGPPYLALELAQQHGQDLGRAGPQAREHAPVAGGLVARHGRHLRLIHVGDAPMPL